MANALKLLVRLDCRETFEIAAQVFRKDDGATTALHGTQGARANSFIETCPTCTRDCARFGDAISQR